MTPGNQTSEFQLTKLSIKIGATLTILGAVLPSIQAAVEQLQAIGINAPWTGVVITICGALMAMIGHLGYTVSRTKLKTIDATFTARSNGVQALNTALTGLMPMIQGIGKAMEEPNKDNPMDCNGTSCKRPSTTEELNHG